MSETQLSGVDQLFGTIARRYKIATLPVSQAVIRIQSLTERELSAYHAKAIKPDGRTVNKERIDDSNRRLIVLCLVDSAGNRILNDSHTVKIGDWDSADASFAYDQCASHVGLKSADIEGLAKNCETTAAGV